MLYVQYIACLVCCQMYSYIYIIFFFTFLTMAALVEPKHVAV
jgi:hypothetical protein